MKTRFLIIIGIVLASIIFGTYQSLMYQCGSLPVFMETPRNPNLWNCLEIWENQPDQLTKILDYCKQKGTGIAMHQPGLKYYNETHYIDNNTCEWIPVYQKDDVSFEDFSDERLEQILEWCTIKDHKPFLDSYWQNETHYVSAPDCQWGVYSSKNGITLDQTLGPVDRMENEN